MLVWHDGQFIEHTRAAIPVFDAGLQHGIGLFETMRARHGAVFRAADHMHRLVASARQLLLSERLRGEPIIDAMHLTLERNQLRDARVRLTITGGNLGAAAPSSAVVAGNGERSSSRAVDPSLLIVAQPPTEYPPGFFERGVMITIADGRENPFDPMAGHKTLHYWPRILALQVAAAKRAAESLWLTVTNHLACGCVSNIFLVKDDRLLTPLARGEEDKGAVPAPVRPGITRAAVLELADVLDVSAERRLLDIHDLLGADEVFLTNSAWGVLPVVQVERQAIGAGEVGPMTRQFRSALLNLIDQETQAESL